MNNDSVLFWEIEHATSHATFSYSTHARFLLFKSCMTTWILSITAVVAMVAVTPPTVAELMPFPLPQECHFIHMAVCSAIPCSSNSPSR